MSTYASNTPLHEMLTWKENDCVVICDSVLTDGRFVLVQDVVRRLQNTSSSSRRRTPVLWLGCGPTSEALILQSLKKMLCDDLSNCTIHNVSFEFGKLIEKDENLDNIESFIKSLYCKVDDFINASKSCCVVVDDVSMLATLVGERLTYAFIASLTALSVSADVGLLLRVALDADHRKEERQANAKWIGAGGSNSSDPNVEILFGRSIVELADVIVDVVPLASGYTREAHGRLIISRANPDALNQHEVFNYCLHDTKATAIRLER